VTLKSRLGAIEGHWKWHYSIDRIRIRVPVPIRLPLAVLRTVFEIKRDIGRKTPIFHIHSNLTCTMMPRSPKNP